MRGGAVGGEGLEREPGVVGAVGVAAGTVVGFREAVAVDLVDHVEAAVGVGEACCVDGAALVEGAGEGRVDRGVGADYVFGCCGSDAVVVAVAGYCAGEVEHKATVRLANSVSMWPSAMIES